jgi:hypothetical protein
MGKWDGSFWSWDNPVVSWLCDRGADISNLADHATNGFDDPHSLVSKLADAGDVETHAVNWAIDNPLDATHAVVTGVGHGLTEVVATPVYLVVDLPNQGVRLASFTTHKLGWDHADWGSERSFGHESAKWMANKWMGEALGQNQYVGQNKRDAENPDYQLLSSVANGATQIILLTPTGPAKPSLLGEGAELASKGKQLGTLGKAWKGTKAVLDNPVARTVGTAAMAYGPIDEQVIQPARRKEQAATLANYLNNAGLPSNTVNNALTTQTQTLKSKNDMLKEQLQVVSMIQEYREQKNIPDSQPIGVSLSDGSLMVVRNNQMFVIDHSKILPPVTPGARNPNDLSKIFSPTALGEPDPFGRWTVPNPLINPTQQSLPGNLPAPAPRN